MINWDSLKLLQIVSKVNTGCIFSGDASKLSFSNIIITQ